MTSSRRRPGRRSPGAYRSSVFTTRSPRRSRSAAQSVSRSCERRPLRRRTLITCLPSGASDGSDERRDRRLQVRLVADRAVLRRRRTPARGGRSTGAITIRPARRSGSPPSNDGRPESARLTFEIAPGGADVGRRQRRCGPISTGSQQRRDVRFGSIAVTTARAAISEPSASMTPVARCRSRPDLDDLGAGADLDAEDPRAALASASASAPGAAARERRLPRRPAVVAGRVREQHRRRARRPRAHRRVLDASSRERPPHRVALERLRDEVGDRHRQRARRLAARLLRRGRRNAFPSFSPVHRVGERRAPSRPAG